MPQQETEPRDDWPEESLTPPSRPEWCSPLSDKLLAILFVAFLLAPPVAYLTGWKSRFTLSENRDMAPAPVLSSDPVTIWPEKIEAYYADRFGFRADLVHLYSLVLHKYMGSSNADVVIGKDGWTFYAQQDIFRDFFGKAPLSSSELERWKAYLEGNRARLAKDNVHYLFVVAPDKDTVYSEYLPAYIQNFRGQSRWQQLKEYLRQTGSPVEILDLHEPLMNAKTQGMVYYPHDAHWNGRGFFVGYLEMCKVLSRWFPNITPLRLGIDYSLVEIPSALGDWALLGLPEENLKHKAEVLSPLGTLRAAKSSGPMPPGIPFIPEADYLRRPLLLDGPGQGSLLVFHDSFMRFPTVGLEGVPLAEHFKRTLLVGREPSHEEFAAIVDSFRPDVVIEERVERNMRLVPAAPTPAPTPAQAAPNPPVPAAVPPALSPATSQTGTCSNSESLFEARPVRPIVPANATIEMRSSGLSVKALNSDPYIWLPSLQHALDRLSIRITTPEDTTMEVYVVVTGDANWAFHPLREKLTAGLNNVAFQIPKGATALRIDPGDKKLVYTIHQIRYQWECK